MLEFVFLFLLLLSFDRSIHGGTLNTNFEKKLYVTLLYNNSFKIRRLCKNKILLKLVRTIAIAIFIG